MRETPRDEHSARSVFFWALGISYLAATFLFLSVPLGWSGIGFFFLLGTALFFWFLRSDMHMFRTLTTFVCFGIILAGMRVMSVPQTLSASPPDGVAEISGRVVSDIDHRERSDTLTFETMLGDQRALILVSVPPHTTISYNDHVSLKGNIEIPESFTTDTGTVFDYPSYLSVSGISYVMQRAVIVSREKGNWSPLRTLFAIKQKFLEGLSLSLPEPYQGLAAGITIGEKHALGKEVADTFRTAGIMHIVVLSGYNITVLTVFVLFLFARLPRTARLWCAGIVIALFVLMTGASATGVRAGVMALISLFALWQYRPQYILRALMMATVGMVLWNPLILLYDPGFHLSVIATTSLILGTPILARHLTWIRHEIFCEALAATLATQIGVLPYLLFFSGQVPVYGLIANILTLPLVPVAMFLSLGLGFIGAFIGDLAALISFPSYAVLFSIVEVAERIAQLPYASLTLPPLPLLYMCAIYLALMSIAWRIAQRIPSNSGS